MFLLSHVHQWLDPIKFEIPFSQLHVLVSRKQHETMCTKKKIFYSFSVLFWPQI